MSKIQVSKIPRVNTLVIKQTEGQDFFVASKNIIVLPVESLAHLLSFLVIHNYISPRVLEGVLEEYNTEGSLLDDIT